MMNSILRDFTHPIPNGVPTVVYQGKLSQRASVSIYVFRTNFIAYQVQYYHPTLIKIVDHDHEMSKTSVYMKIHIYPNALSFQINLGQH